MFSSYPASRSLNLVALVAALLIVAGCGGSADGTMDTSVMMPDGSVPTPDSAIEGPHVVSTTPSSGAVGVTEDAVFVFAFSEAMDTQATEAAYQSEELPASEVSFLWNDEGDHLTVIPNDPLPYAEGDELVEALAFGMRITTDATNTDGEPLAEEAALDFTTLRRIVVNPPRVASTSGRVTSSGLIMAGSFVLGDGASNGAFSSFVTFSLDSLPNTVTLETARLQAAESIIIGTPDDDLGTLVAQHVYFDALDENAYAAELLATVPNQVNMARTAGEITFFRSADVTAFVQSDVDNRDERGDMTRARMRFSTATDSQNDADQVQLVADQVTLRVTYLAE